MPRQRLLYPFPAVVGQERVKRSLIINAIDPTIGGVLIVGSKGSGKSLIVRAFSQLLPEVEAVADCPFRCHPHDPTNMCPQCLSRFKAGEPLPVSKVPMELIEMPLSITDDMLVGTLDLDKVAEGVRALQPGLLAEANQNILYIDQVNLLPDHIVDCILDAAASGWNIVEREGVSIQHPARFILIGTMNPEEGELRPQILDRFGIYVETETIADPDIRSLILERCEEYASDPIGFVSRFSAEVEELRRRIKEAKRLLPEVEVPEEVYSTIAEVCSSLKVDGFRPDIVAVRAARALAAFHGSRIVSEEDVTSALELALGHRTRRAGLQPPPTKAEIKRSLRRARLKLHFGVRMPRISGLLLVPYELFRRLLRRSLLGYAASLAILVLLTLSITYLIETFRRSLTATSPTPHLLILEALLGLAITLFLLLMRRPRRKVERVAVAPRIDLSKVTLEVSGRLTSQRAGGGGGGRAPPARVDYREREEPKAEFGFKIFERIERLERPLGVGPRRVERRPLRVGGYERGRRLRRISTSRLGRHAWHRIPRGRPTDIALVPTIKVAALRGASPGRPRIRIQPEDLREKVREYRAPYSIILLIDVSLSMIESMGNLIEAIYTLHRDVYRRRDRVGLIVFKGSRAYPLQHPTTNLDLVVEKLKTVGASDFTPMAAGLMEALKMIKRERMRNREALIHLIVISDGIANVPLDTPISPLTRRRYLSEAQADALDAARLIAKEGVMTHIINTNHSEEDAETPPTMDERWRIRLTPTQFLVELARTMKGDYRGLTLKQWIS
jgi:Mg-chelatase subunit ChlI/Mg-chelatase subunit ChlD